MAHKQYRPGPEAEKQIQELRESISRETGIRVSANEAAAELIRKGHLQWRVSRHGMKEATR